jgi:hypothetical protein
MKRSCAVLAFVILTTLMHGQQPTAGSPDDHSCDDAMFRTLCLHVVAQGRETEQLLKDAEKLRSGEPSKQIEGIVDVGTKTNSRFNDHAISKTVTDESIKTIGGVAQQESKTLSDAERSIQTVFTPSEQADFTRQMNHYTQAIVTSEAPQMTGQVSGNRVSGQQSERVSPSEQVRQARPPSSWHSDVFSAEEQRSIDRSLSTGILKQHEQDKAAARAAALAEKQRQIDENNQRRIADEQAKAQAAWLTQHPQQVIPRVVIPPAPPSSNHVSCGDAPCTAR